MTGSQPLKRVHHVVPQSWQRRFFPITQSGKRDSRGYYKDVKSGKLSGPEGPGDKMSEEYANLIFDDNGQPSNALEDRIAGYETKAIPALDRVESSKQIGPKERIDIAYLLGLQSSRYPELFSVRLDLVKYLAIALGDVERAKDAAEFNAQIKGTGLLPGVDITEDDFNSLRALSSDRRDTTVDAIVSAHGYEGFVHPGLVIDGALRAAEHIIALNWDLLEASTPSFLLSDRPVPPRNAGYAFSVPLTSRFAIVLSQPIQPVTDTTIVHARHASSAQIDAVNHEVRARAQQWICGPDTWVHGW